MNTYKQVLPRVQELIPKWRSVTLENFSTHKWDMHKSYADALQSLIKAEEKLKRMVKEARGEDQEYESDEGAEDE